MTAQTYTLSPYRYSTDVPAMVRLLEVAGLTTIISSTSGRFAILVGRNGRVGVHATSNTVTGSPAGGTTLSFEVPDVDAAAAELQGAGLDVVTWDESYGRHAGVHEPRGGGVWINEEMRDFYGYEQVAPAADPRPVDVITVYFTPDFAAAEEFFAHFGFHHVRSPRSGGDEDPSWRSLRSAEPLGVVGLHHAERVPDFPAGSPADPVAPPSLVALGLETAEPLEEVAAALRTAGFADAVVVDEGGDVHVSVSDPDGKRIEIHPGAIG